MMFWLKCPHFLAGMFQTRWCFLIVYVLVVNGLRRISVVELLGPVIRFGGLIPVSWRYAKWFRLENLSALVTLTLYIIKLDMSLLIPFMSL